MNNPSTQFQNFLIETLKRENKWIFNLLENMVFVKGGPLTLLNQHDDVVVDDHLSDFYICKYPITQLEWNTFVNSNPSTFQGENLPVVNVSWEQCHAFCLLLSNKTGLQVSLPTFGQWQFAALGGTLSKYYQYAGSDNLEEVAWFSSNCSSIKPVGLKKPNELGLYDMHGNVLEWCLHPDSPYRKPLVGGCFAYSHHMCTTYIMRSKGHFNSDIGFRVVINNC